MMPPAGETARGVSTFFNPATKCCTYLPELHNFLVGSALDDPDSTPDGLSTLERRIDERVGVTPLGLDRPRTYFLIYQNRDEGVFGHARGLRCPHYLEEHGGRCGVWKHRNAVCATWFCKHNRGATGETIWTAIRRLLGLAEIGLAWWCVREVGLDTAALHQLLDRQEIRNPKATRNEIDSTADAMHEKLWGTWAGREREFFRACGSKVRTLAWDDVVRICGPELAVATDVLRSLVVASHAADLPARLEVAPFTVTAVRGDQATLATYRGYDPLSVPIALLDVLDAFDGRETREVLEGLLRDREIDLEPGFLRRLVDFGILRPIKAARQ
jgi:hypothetical protein